MLFFLCDQGVRAKLFPPWLLDDEDEFFLV
jgi:hypothetical protein